MVIRGRFCLRSFFFVRTMRVPQQLRIANVPEMGISQWQMGDGRECYDILRGLGSFSLGPRVGRHVTMCVKFTL